MNNLHEEVASDKPGEKVAADAEPKTDAAELKTEAAERRKEVGEENMVEIEIFLNPIFYTQLGSENLDELDRAPVVA